MSKRTCSVDGCDKPEKSRGWCSAHYERWRKHGTTDDLRPTPLERFWAKVDKSGPGGCWLWVGQLNRSGYGVFSVGNVKSLAHRWAHEAFIGPIPPDYQVDHVYARGCRHTQCVNPAHLEAVTPRENTMRSSGFAPKKAAQTHCVHGHEFTAENTNTRRGRRECRACMSSRRTASWKRGSRT